MKLNILCLYHDIMNLYGDTGNINVIKYHLDEQNIKYKIDYLSIDNEINFTKYDLILIGNGTENQREIALNHLINYKKEIKEAIENNKFFLITGNALSMFSNKLYDKKALETFNFEVTKSKERISKEVIINSNISSPIYGFMNHEDINNIKENHLFESEGIHYKNFYGTYVIGPILSRNPEFLEYFLKDLIKSKDKNFKIKKLNIKLNKQAYNEFIEFKKTKVFNSKNT